MRKLQNTVSNFGNVNVRQGNVLVVRVEALRSLCARLSSALYSSASRLVQRLRSDAWQGPCFTWLPKHGLLGLVGTVDCFVTAVFVTAETKQDQRRHLIIMCHRAAA